MRATYTFYMNSVLINANNVYRPSFAICSVLVARWRQVLNVPSYWSPVGVSGPLLDAEPCIYLYTALPGRKLPCHHHHLPYSTGHFFSVLRTGLYASSPVPHEYHGNGNGLMVKLILNATSKNATSPYPSPLPPHIFLSPLVSPTPDPPPPPPPTIPPSPPSPPSPRGLTLSVRLLGRI